MLRQHVLTCVLLVLSRTLLLAVCRAPKPIDRKTVVSRYNPTRNASSPSTPMQVGNGNFAFGADVTGLQTFLPFAIMSSWGWKNDSLPAGRTMEDIFNYVGESLDNHGREVEYMFGGADAEIQNWLIKNPNRVNLGRVGLIFLQEDGGGEISVTENELGNKRQVLDLWTGILTSTFEMNGTRVVVETVCDQENGVVGINITSHLLSKGRLGLFLDFPWNDGSQKFEAPFVGVFNTTANHTTTVTESSTKAGRSHIQIAHKLVNNTFLTTVDGGTFRLSRVKLEAHRYTILPTSPTKGDNFAATVTYSLRSLKGDWTYDSVKASSEKAWESYWSQGGFVDVVSDSSDLRADELQRRIVLSQYLLRVNEAGDYPPQESGLVNNGWYGKFHMEMFFWHCIHWALWSQWDLFHRSSPTYSRFLPTSFARSQVQQGWTSGARWSKMTDPSGRSAPGEINELLIWQQVHPLVFAEYEYRAFPTKETLQKWEDVVTATADWMSVFAFWNESTGVYDLGPPMYVVSEDTDPLVTTNPSFELAYWNFGLGLAHTWMERLGQATPSNWTRVQANLAHLPNNNATYSVYEGIEDDFWDDPAFTNDHPSLVGLHGWLPQTSGVDLSMAKATMERVWTHWNISNCWGWDFGMLAMSAARNGEPEKAIDWLLDDIFSFDDVGMPTGGARVPTPYFPGSGSLLLAVALMAGGWDGSNGNAPGFPTDGWVVNVEGINKAL